MKKALIVVAAIALGALIVWWFATALLSRVWAKDAVAAEAGRPWPGGMGTLNSVAARYPQQPANGTSVTLTALAKTLPKDDAAVQFVTREVERGELAIGEPPALPDVSAMRELLLREPVVWGRPGGVHDIGDQPTTAARAVQMAVARSLVASALAKARAGDAAAWEDLHAVWNLARSLDGQPQVMSQTAALSMVRMIYAVAWKLPLPPPPWLAEVQDRDALRPLLEAYQYETASYWQRTAHVFPSKWLAASVEHDRRIAEALSRDRRCDVHALMNDLGTDLSSVWRRAFRSRAEGEAAANALRVRQGRPIEPRSRCSDGAWTFDGTTLRFSRAIPTAPPDRPMPLVLRVKP